MSTAIFEMAFEKKKAIDNANNLQLPIAQHLVKLEMYSESLLVNHWTVEVNAWLKKIQSYKVKATTKPLDNVTLLKILFEEPLGDISDVQWRMDEAYEDYPDLEINQPNASIIHKTLTWKLQSVCQDIANRQFKDIRNYK